FENLSYVHAARHAQGIKHNFNGGSIGQERHVFLRHDAGDNAFISVATSHLIAHAQFALAGGVNFDLFDDSRVDIVTAFHPVHGAIAFEFQLRELVFVGANDFADLIANRTRIDLDVIVGRRQLSQERFGDLAIGWNDDLAVLGVYDIQRNFFAEQNVGKRIRQLLNQPV